MKTRKLYYKLLLLLLAAVIQPLPGLLAQQYEKSRKEDRVFPANNETSVQIINKYGNIHVLPWAKDSIRIEIDIKVEASKQSKVEKTYDNIKIEFSESSYYIIAQTVFGNQKSAFWADVTDFTSSMLNSGSNAQIDYTVYLPPANELNIENKFGNIYMTDHNGKVVVRLSNGDLRGGRFESLELDHGFGNVVLDSVNIGDFTLSYTEMKLNHATDLRINSKSSKPNIKGFGSLRLNSKRDTYFIEQAGLINGETSFSYLTINEQRGDLILNTNYGDLSIDDYGRGFSMMNLASRYTDISMICNEGFSYYLEVYYNDKTRMIYPKSPPIFMVKTLEEKEDEFLLSGHAGSNSEDVPRLKINIEGGSVNLVHQ